MCPIGFVLLLCLILLLIIRKGFQNRTEKVYRDGWRLRLSSDRFDQIFNSTELSSIEATLSSSSTPHASPVKQQVEVDVHRESNEGEETEVKKIGEEERTEEEEQSEENNDKPKRPRRKNADYRD